MGPAQPCNRRITVESILLCERPSLLALFHLLPQRVRPVNEEANSSGTETWRIVRLLSTPNKKCWHAPISLPRNPGTHMQVPLFQGVWGVNLSFFPLHP